MTIKQPLFDAARKYRRKFGNRGYWEFKGGSPERLEALEIDRAWRVAWEACKEYAIEREVGLR